MRSASVFAARSAFSSSARFASMASVTCCLTSLAVLPMTGTLAGIGVLHRAQNLVKTLIAPNNAYAHIFERLKRVGGFDTAHCRFTQCV